MGTAIICAAIILFIILIINFNKKKNEYSDLEHKNAELQRLRNENADLRQRMGRLPDAGPMPAPMAKAPAPAYKPYARTWEEPEGFECGGDFGRAFGLMENTACNLFITGRAGTGKSTLLQYFRKNTKKRAAYIAPTGVAALNITGKTIHSFFLLPPMVITPGEIEKK